MEKNVLSDIVGIYASALATVLSFLRGVLSSLLGWTGIHF